MDNKTYHNLSPEERTAYNRMRRLRRIEKMLASGLTTEEIDKIKKEKNKKRYQANRDAYLQRARLRIQRIKQMASSKNIDSDEYINDYLDID